MLLPEFLLDALPEDSASCITLYCDDETKHDELCKAISGIFDAEWERQAEIFEEEVGMEPDEIEVPIMQEPFAHDGKIEIALLSLDMQANDGARGFPEYGCEAVNDTIRRFKEAYPEVPVHCSIQFEWYDEHTSETVQYEFPKESKVLPEVTAKAIEASIKSGDMEEHLHEFVEFDEDMLKELKKFIEKSKPFLSEDAAVKFAEIADQIEIIEED